ncbi:hypothetical protein FXN63_04510 [Pigmentiphaga aceris]|uniref:Uncharacterized protein n=1 Tax=Pigmentiphaga aceris TaxID=1940612 RepID=A0A5C0ASE5_9BURK|nr:hypothetical protein [Pigmentiphaga aceris]QEI05179.1 hypothetical protein FXN63_04510 [Pigmentiphaga aceris]
MMMKRIALTIAAVLAVVGAGLLAYASMLAPFTDQQEFYRRYLQLQTGQNAEFHGLLREFLSAKYELVDYGWTLIVLAGVAWLVARFGSGGIKSPPVRRSLVRLAYLAAFAVFFALEFTVFQNYDRGYYPRWADSIAPLLVGGVLVLLVMLGWTFAHLRLLPRDYPASKPLQLAVSGKVNPWLMLLSLAAIGLAVAAASQGAWPFLIAGLLWAYVYVSIAASRRAVQLGRTAVVPH